MNKYIVRFIILNLFVIANLASKDILLSKYRILKKENPGLSENCSPQNGYFVTDQPPFYISETYLQGDKKFENLRDSNSNIISYLPEGSIIETKEAISEKLKIQIEKEELRRREIALNRFSKFPNAKMIIENLHMAELNSISELSKKVFTGSPENIQKNAKKLSYDFGMYLNDLENDNELKNIKKEISSFKVPVEILYSNDALVKQLEKRDVSGLGPKTQSAMISFKKHGRNNPKSGKSFSKKFDDGYINANSLGLYNKFSNVFYVKKETPLFKNLNLENIQNGVALKYNTIMDGGIRKFQAKKCCVEINQTRQCAYSKYSFSVLDGEGSNAITSKSIDVDLSCCKGDLNRSLQVIPEKHFNSFFNALNIIKEDTDSYKYEDNLLLAQNIAFTGKVKNSNGDLVRHNTILDNDLMKLPIYDAGNVKSGESIKFGAFGSFHYEGSMTRDESNDEWMKPVSSCAVLQILKKWREINGRNDESRIGIGNAYHPYNMIHKSHASGECIDIRPFSHSDHFKKIDITRNSNYNREKTVQLLKFLYANGASNIIFNDSVTFKEQKIKSEFKFKLDENHKTHIHVCFKQDDPQVKNTCKNGATNNPQYRK